MADDTRLDLSRARVALDEARLILEALDGLDLDERAAIDGKHAGRSERARKSQALSLLADRLELAAALVRAQYWAARGHNDPTAPS